MKATLWLAALLACGGRGDAPVEVRSVEDARRVDEGSVVVQGRLGVHTRLAEGPVPAVALGDGALVVVAMDRLPNPLGLVDALDGQPVRVVGDLAEAGPGLAVSREPRPQGDAADLIQVDYTVEAASLSVGER